MFDFIYSEVWLMETIITAVLAAVVALITAYFMYLGKMNKVLDKIKELTKEHEGLSNSHMDLSGEHKGLSGEHKGLSDEHKAILSDGRKIIDTTERTGRIVDDMRSSAEKENEAQRYRYDNLTEKQKSITENVIDTVKAFEALKDEFLCVNEKNSTLQSRMQIISEESNELKTFNAKLEWKNHELKQEFDKLLAHDNKMVEKCNRYAKEINKLQQSEEPEQTSEFDDEWEMER